MFSILITKKMSTKLFTLSSLFHFLTCLSAFLSLIWQVSDPSFVYIWEPFSDYFSLIPDTPVSKEASSLNPRTREGWGISESQYIWGSSVIISFTMCFKYMLSFNTHFIITSLYTDVENGGLEKFSDFPKIIKQAYGEARNWLAELSMT